MFKLTMPFSALGIFFLAIGLLLVDLKQIYFGLFWFLTALVAYFWKKKVQSTKNQ